MALWQQREKRQEELRDASTDHAGLAADGSLHGLYVHLAGHLVHRDMSDLHVEEGSSLQWTKRNQKNLDIWCSPLIVRTAEEP